MTIDWQQAGISAVTSVLAGVISAALTARWALERFRSEKWWQTKLESYAEIARALFLLKRYVDEWIRAYELRYERTEEFERQLNDDWHRGSRAVEEATVLGSFIISPLASTILDQLRLEKATGDPDDPYLNAMVEAAALDKAIRAFVAAAKDDLGVSKAKKLSSHPSAA